MCLSIIIYSLSHSGSILPKHSVWLIDPKLLSISLSSGCVKWAIDVQVQIGLP